MLHGFAFLCQNRINIRLVKTKMKTEKCISVYLYAHDGKVYRYIK